jgi:ABC-type sugar transport system substrate-binding protein
VESGGNSAAAAFGDTLAISETNDPQTEISTIKSLIAQHVAAIAVDGGFLLHTADVNQALAQARSAGIPTLSFEQGYPGSVWVTPSSSAQYAHALADALATQMRQRGQFVIIPCRPAQSIVDTWLKETKFYIRRRYPRMSRVGVVYGGVGNGAAGTLVLHPLLKEHPHLRGLIFLCQSETFTGPPQLVRAHKVGRIFSAGNGNPCPPLYVTLASSVRAGSAEIVCAGDFTKLGYLTIWAADYLAGGHTLTQGSYGVGGVVGTVHYYRHNQELRLGQPLTITRANLDQYGIQR